MSKVLILLVVILSSCTPIQPPEPPAITSASSNLARIEAHNQSAKELTTTAIPTATPVGQSLLTQANKEHDNVQLSAEATRQDLIQETANAAVLMADRDIAQGKVKEIKASKQYRLGWTVWIIGKIVSVLMVIHIVFGILGMILPDPYGKIGTLVASIVNPPAWLIFVLSHLQVKPSTGAV